MSKLSMSQLTAKAAIALSSITARSESQRKMSLLLTQTEIALADLGNYDVPTGPLVLGSIEYPNLEELVVSLRAVLEALADSFARASDAATPDIEMLRALLLELRDGDMAYDELVARLYPLFPEDLT
jgi:hypothetical protein